MSKDQDTQADDNLDDHDYVSPFQMEENRQALANLRERLGTEVAPDFDGQHCVDCGNAIPMLRQALGRVRCFDCQQALELHRSTNRKNDQAP